MKNDYFDMDAWTNPVLLDRLLQYATTALGAIIFLVIGWFIINLVIKWLKHVLEKRSLDKTLQKPALAFIDVFLKISLFLAVTSTIGIETTSFLAVLSAAGLAIGLALQGSLSNLAGGILLLVLRPIRVDEYVEIQGVQGFVRAIGLFLTTIENNDRATVFVPNSELANHRITNFSRAGMYRLNIAIGVAYNADVENTRKVLLQVMHDNPLVFKDPEPRAVISALADSSVNWYMRPWCDASNSKILEVQLLEATKIALDKAGIEIPYPHQVQVHKN